MKRIPFRFIIVLLAVGLTYACTECKECRQITKDKGVVIEEGYWIEYCGDELIEIETQEPVQVGTQSIEWECRSVSVF